MFAGIGRFCIRRRRLVLVASLVLFVVGIGVGGQVFGHLRESNGSAGAESVRGFQLLDRVSGRGPGVVAVVDGEIRSSS